MSAEYTVKLPIFEGPLDLLLHLIKASEMEITEISISQITSQYLETLRLMETLDLEVAGDFLVMAATLLNIKLRTILPEPEEELEEGEKEDEGDDYLTARALMQRLIEYRRFKEAALTLGGMAERQSLIFVREVALPAISQAQADPGVRGDLGLLLEAFSRVVQFVQRRNYHEVQGEEYTVEDKITLVRRRILLESRIAVNDLFSECHAKIEMIVTLIALLELCRLKELRISQIDSYGSIVAFPRPRGEEAPPVDAAGEAEELKRVEAEILANRTGLVDNSPPPPDEEDALLERVLNMPSDGDPAPETDETPEMQDTLETFEAPEAPETTDEESGARIIDIALEPHDPDGLP